MLRSLLALKPRDVPIRVALRNTIAVVAPLAVGLALGQASAGLAIATGALNTMFTDQPGPYRARMQRMLMAAAAAGLAALLGILIGAHDVAFVAAVLVVAFCGGIVVALGPIAARVGLTSTIVMLVTAGMGLSPPHAPAVAALIFAGGLLQMALAVAAWPLQRYRPERFALADVLRQLARTARLRPDAAQAPPVSQAALDALVLLHGEHRARGPAMQSFRVLAEVCERARIDLLSLSDLHARLTDTAARQRLEPVFGHAADCLDALADAVHDARPPSSAPARLDALQASVKAMAADDARPADRRDARLWRIAHVRADSLAGQLRSLARNAATASSRGELQAQKSEARLPAALRTGAPWPTLRANLTLSSVAFRHALRCAICVALAAGCERALQVPHGAWIPMTAAVVIKPDFGGTLRFGLLRMAGTFAGLLLTTLLAHYAMQGVAPRLLLMAALCMGFRLLAQVNYGLGIALLTGMVVLLLSFKGMAPADAVHARLLGTVLGSSLALVAYALWPTWEGRRVKPLLAALVDAYRRHLAAVLGARIGELVDSRAAARRARTNAQASLDRLRAEPRRRTSAAALKWAESVLANASRLIRATVMLEALLRDGAPLPQREQLAAFAAEADRILVLLVTALREDREVDAPLLRPCERRLSTAMSAAVDAGDAAAIAAADACDRIADSIDTLAHLLRPAARRQARERVQPAAVSAS
ncbi:FUSC family protein [Cognatiluteimonas telluris]|uniref:FUSC family protein n=1 Tax=Cognatiluteimonas telluris TaxID=1104775 RepID=UPI001407EBC5|nr:FUSC family protein [Lysobacter telluris]